MYCFGIAIHCVEQKIVSDLHLLLLRLSTMRFLYFLYLDILRVIWNVFFYFTENRHRKFSIKIYYSNKITVLKYKDKHLKQVNETFST